MKFPTVHSNGTSAEELLKHNLAAVEALDEAIASMTSAYPNGRDFYVQGAQAFEEAAAEFMHRAQRVDAVRREFLEIVGAIHQQITDRKR